MSHHLEEATALHAFRPCPAPLAGAVRLDEVELRRHLRCPLYGACLETARRLDWRSFTCEACRAYTAAAAARA